MSLRLMIHSKNIIFLLNFAVFLQQSVTPLYVHFDILEHYVVVEKVHQ